MSSERETFWGIFLEEPNEVEKDTDVHSPASTLSNTTLRAVMLIPTEGTDKQQQIPLAFSKVNLGGTAMYFASQCVRPT